MSIAFTPLVTSLPAAVPFVGPETLERNSGHVFRARLGGEGQDLGGWFMKRVDPQQRELLQTVQIIRDSRNTPGARH